MNIQLAGTEEFIDGKSTGSLGQVLIRYAFLLSIILGGREGGCGGRRWQKAGSHVGRG